MVFPSVLASLLLAMIHLSLVLLSPLLLLLFFLLSILEFLLWQESLRRCPLRCGHHCCCHVKMFPPVLAPLLLLAFPAAPGVSCPTLEPAVDVFLMLLFLPRIPSFSSKDSLLWLEYLLSLPSLLLLLASMFLLASLLILASLLLLASLILLSPCSAVVLKNLTF
jgi:hypothetical protein